MRVLAISHSCITDVNQQLYIALQAMSDTSVELVVPDTWKSEYSGQPLSLTLLPGVNFPVHPLPVVRSGNNSLHFYRRGLARTIRESRAEVVFIDEEPWSLATAQAASICRRLRIPFVCYTKQNILKRYPPPFSWLERRTYRTAASVVALSEEVRTVLRDKGYRGPCPLLAHGCDLSLFSKRTSDRRRDALGLHGVVVGYMGRLVPEKGVDTLIEAISLLRREKPERDVMALLVGSGPEEQALKQQAAEAQIAPHVIFAGSVPHREAGETMACMDIFALPSRTMPNWKEQFGRVIVEALACAVPVVGSNSGQIPILINDCEGGLVFEEGNAADLAGKIASLVDAPNTRAQLGARGADAVRQRYTYAAIASALHGILQESLNSSPTATPSPRQAALVK